MPIAAPSTSRPGINQLLVCRTMGPDGGVLRGVSAQTATWVSRAARCWRSSGGSDGEDVNDYVCTE